MNPTHEKLAQDLTRLQALLGAENPDARAVIEGCEIVIRRIDEAIGVTTTLGTLPEGELAVTSPDPLVQLVSRCRGDLQRDHLDVLRTRLVEARRDCFGPASGSGAPNLGAGDPNSLKADDDAGDDLNSLKKDALLELAKERGVEVNAKATKADIIAALTGPPPSPQE